MLPSQARWQITLCQELWTLKRFQASFSKQSEERAMPLLQVRMLWCTAFGLELVFGGRSIIFLAVARQLGIGTLRTLLIEQRDHHCTSCQAWNLSSTAVSCGSERLLPAQDLMEWRSTLPMVRPLLSAMSSSADFLTRDDLHKKSLNLLGE